MAKQEKIVAELEAIRVKHGGLLKPEDVVEFARDPETELHSEFTWDDSKAAHAHRLWQARCVIRMNVVVMANDADPVPVYVSLTTDRMNPGGGYRALVDVMKNPDQYEQLLRDAMKELESFQKKYSALKELAPVMRAAKKVQKKHDARCAIEQPRPRLAAQAQ